MPSDTNSKTKDLRLAVLVAALVGLGGLAPLAWHYFGREHRAAPGPDQVATAPTTTPTPSPTPAQPPAAEADNEVAPPAPPGAEVVPPEESETDRGATSASPAGPTLSNGRAAGLHLAPDPLHLNSSAALVMDQDTRLVLAQKNDGAVLPMASLTKLMTTLLVLEAKQPMDEVLTITEEDVDNERHSRSRLRVGATLTREEALRLALMSSENRAAHALGRNYPGGVPKLVEAMNARARVLGMTSTSYVDPTGLSNRNQSTAQDLARLVAEASRNPVIREFSTTPDHVASLGGRTLQYRNSNRLVRDHNSGWDILLQKTGYIVEAGRCLTMVARVAGHNLIMVLLDADSNGARMADAQRLRKWVVAQNGWQDEQPVLAKAPAEPPRARVAAAKDKRGKSEKVASAKSHKSGKADKADKAAKKSGKTSSRTEVAAKKKTKPARDVDVAKKPEAKKDRGGRVRQTFAAGRNEQKG